MLIPTVLEKTDHGERAYDIYSRLLKERIVFFFDEVNTASASIAIAQLTLLNAEDPEKPITLYINSPGGSVTDGMAIIDTMNLIKAPVRTVVTGMAASMGAMLLMCGKKGDRAALKHSKIMIHQPSGGAKGQATEILNVAKEIEKTQTMLYNIISEQTGKSFDEIKQDCDRDYYLTAEEAKAYGIIDEII